MSEKQPYTPDPTASHQMRQSRVLRKIAAGGVARVLKLNTFDVKVAEIFAQARPDALWLCQEHTSARIYDVDSLVRVARGS
jgi:4-hydroxy-2-oxoheptanedioate aldolase